MKRCIKLKENENIISLEVLLASLGSNDSRVIVYQNARKSILSVLKKQDQGYAFVYLDDLTQNRHTYQHCICEHESVLDTIRAAFDAPGSLLVFSNLSEFFHYAGSLCHVRSI